MVMGIMLGHLWSCWAVLDAPTQFASMCRTTTTRMNPAASVAEAMIWVGRCVRIAANGCLAICPSPVPSFEFGSRTIHPLSSAPNGKPMRSTQRVH